jgi:anti-sigma regulatory factor (Ser/Thr protein kinase)
MEMKALNLLRVEESSQVGEARRLAASMGKDLGFDGVRMEQVSIVVTEMATNMIKHAGGGDLILHALQVEETSGIETLALDKGPGIRSVDESLRDGYSTSGSLGTGLGAIQRLSSLCDLYSMPGQGTVVLSRIWRQSPPAAAPPHPLEVGVVCLPVATEQACGDAWAVHQSRERALILVADGLGHGKYAAEASAEAAKVFENYVDNSPAQMIERIHVALHSTRGAAVSVAELSWGQRILRYAGVGNVSGRIFSGETARNMVSHNGTVGFEARKIQEFTYPWPEDGLLILHSDGLDTHWTLDDYPGLRGRHPALIAGVLFRDHNRVRDDSTVVAIKEARRSP